MKNYLKLFNFELNRFIKIYVVLVALVIVAQITGVFVLSRSYLSMAEKVMFEEGITQAAFLEMYGTFSFIDVVGSTWFMGPIALSAAGLIFYVFLIWYRDWFGKNTFIYRLLMLPTNRLNVYLAKASSIVLMVLGLVGVQLALLVVESKILKWIVPATFRMDYDVPSIIKHSQYLEVLVPRTLIEFVLHYGLGFMAVAVIFTGILLERSYRIKGIILGAIYAAFACALLLLPIVIEEFSQTGFFYMSEVIWLEIALGSFIIALSVWLSNYLLKNKVTV